MTEGLAELLLAEPGDELSRLLFELRWLALRHPIATRAAVRALIAEGRRFAATPGGAAWRARIETSELARRGSSLFELGTLGMLDGDPDAVLPTQLIEAFARAAGRRDLEEALARRLEPDPLDSSEGEG